jgi:hypothetical protein
MEGTGATSGHAEFLRDLEFTSTLTGTGTASGHFQRDLSYSYHGWLNTYHENEMSGSLVASWPAETTVGTIDNQVASSARNVQDGEIDSDVVLGQDSVVDDAGYAYDMNGTGNIEVPGVESEFPLSDSSFFVFGWIELTQANIDSGDKHILFRKGSDSTSGHLELFIQSSQIELYITEDGTDVNSVSITQSISSGIHMIGLYTLPDKQNSNPLKSMWLHLDDSRWSADLTSLSDPETDSGSSYNLFFGDDRSDLKMDVRFMPPGLDPSIAGSLSHQEKLYDVGLNRYNRDGFFQMKSSVEGTGSAVGSLQAERSFQSSSQGTGTVSGPSLNVYQFESISGSLNGTGSVSSNEIYASIVKGSTQGTATSNASSFVYERDIVPLSANGTGTSSGMANLESHLTSSTTGTASVTGILTPTQAFSSYHEWLDGYLNDQGKPANAIWTSDPTSGTTDVDYLGNHDGTLNGSPTLGANPVVDDSGNSFDFDGSDDYSAVNSSSDFDIGSSESITVMGWVDGLSSSTDTVEIVGYWKSGNFHRYYIRPQNDQNRWRAEFLDDSGNSVFMQVDQEFTGTIFTAIVFDRSSDQGKLWINNGNTATDTNSSFGSSTSTNNLEWGRDGRSDRYYVPAKFDVRAVIPYALTDTELQKIYDVGINNSNA